MPTHAARFACRRAAPAGRRLNTCTLALPITVLCTLVLVLASVPAAGAEVLAASGPKIAITPQTWDFGDVRVGESVRKTFVVENVGTEPLIIGSASITTPNPEPSQGFRIVADDASGESIPPGGSGTIELEFTPATGWSSGSPNFLGGVWHWREVVTHYLFGNPIYTELNASYMLKNRGGSGPMECTYLCGGYTSTQSSTAYGGAWYRIHTSSLVEEAPGAVLTYGLTLPPYTHWALWSIDGYTALSGGSISITRLPNAGLRVPSNDPLDTLGYVSESELFGVGVPPPDIVNAFIDSVTPNPAASGGTVSFRGHGTDSLGHVIAAYEWKDGSTVISTKATFTKSNLSVGSHAITLRVKCASNTWSWPTTTTLAITPPPVANDDSATVAEDTTLTVAARGVLANDTAFDSAVLTAAVATPPAHGTLALASNGGYTYRPALNWYGTDHFHYRASDGRAFSNIATVTITVTAVNDAPVARDDTYAVFEDTTRTVAARGVLANDTDVDSAVLTATVTAVPAHGTLKLASTGGYTYRTAANWFGTDHFHYRASDGRAYSNIATVTITVTPVNDAPVARNDAYAVAKNALLTVPSRGVLTNDTDVDSAVLTATVVMNPAHGTLALSSNGGFTYRPATNWYGTDHFHYRASDGRLFSNTATVTIAVRASSPTADSQAGALGGPARTTPLVPLDTSSSARIEMRPGRGHASLM
jgi:VCBS repeat-containing protein